MKDLFVLILLNLLVFLISFLSIRIYDRKTGSKNVSGLIFTYCMAFLISVYMTNTGIKENGPEVTFFNIIIMLLVCLFPISAIINGGFVISIFVKALFRRFRKNDVKGNKPEEQTVRVIKSKRKK